jgi:hypothetical protein
MEFDLTRTAALFLAVIAVGVAVLIVMNVMATNIVLMMVLPAMLVFGLICLGLGVQHGEHRATR